MRDRVCLRRLLRLYSHRATLLLVGLTLLSPLPWRSAAAQGAVLWYEPSNGGKAGGALPDFDQLFDPAHAKDWTRGQHAARVLLLRDNVIAHKEREGRDFIRRALAPFLERSGMKLAIDSGIATFASCRPSQQDKGQISGEVALLRKLARAGIRLSYISMQSTLSKLSGDCPTYSVAQRIQDIVWYMSEVEKAIGSDEPGLQFGLIDASVAKGGNWIEKHLGVHSIEDAYDQLFAALSRQGLRLSYVHLDHPWEAFHEFDRRGPSSFADVRRFQAWVESHGVANGMLLTSLDSADEAQFHDRVLQVEQRLLALGIPNEQLVLAAWSSQPKSELPESPSQPNRYPMTRVLADLGANLR